MNWIEARLERAVQQKRGARAPGEAGWAPDETRPRNPTADSWRAALGAIGFLGVVVLLPCAWAFADTGHRLWAAGFAAAAFVAAGLYVYASRSVRGR